VPAKRAGRIRFLVVISALVLLPSGVRAMPPLLVAFGGDVMLGRGVAQAIDENWEAVFADIAQWLEGADVAFANLESPLTNASQVRRGHDLRADPQAVAALAEAGFDVVSVANNHAWDAGGQGLWETAQTLCRAGIVPAGEPREAVVINGVTECRGKTVEGLRLLAFDDSTASLDVEAAADSVAYAAEGAGPVVVSIHWGGEYQADPSSRQEMVAAALSAAGATIIIGHGPHVLQPIEWVGDTLVAYSLGNLLFDQPYPVDCRWGAILNVELRGKRVTYAEVIPTVVDKGRVWLADGHTRHFVTNRLGLGQSYGKGDDWQDRTRMPPLSAGHLPNCVCFGY